MEESQSLENSPDSNHNAKKFVDEKSPNLRKRHDLDVSNVDNEDYLERIGQKLRYWKACHFENLPSWMKDNEYLLFSHRPQLPNFTECFRSIFQIHTETGNIWTHLIGFLAFVLVTIAFYIKPLCDNCHKDIQVLCRIARRYSTEKKKIIWGVLRLVTKSFSSSFSSVPRCVWAVPHCSIL
jgi:hypothetical protein